jgi:hypothetical protein
MIPAPLTRPLRQATAPVRRLRHRLFTARREARAMSSITHLADQAEIRDLRVQLCKALDRAERGEIAVSALAEALAVTERLLGMSPAHFERDGDGPFGMTRIEDRGDQ